MYRLFSKIHILFSVLTGSRCFSALLLLPIIYGIMEINSTFYVDSHAEECYAGER